MTYSKNEKMIAKVNVRNTGSKAGSEVVQLYVKDLLASVSRPILELKGFQKIYLRPGVSKQVTIEVSVKELQFLDSEMNWAIEKGTYRIMVAILQKIFR